MKIPSFHFQFYTIIFYVLLSLSSGGFGMQEQ